MTSVETANNGVFSGYCPNILSGNQETNFLEDDEGAIEVFRFQRLSSSEIMAQILSSDSEGGEINKIDEVVVQTEEVESRPVGIVTRKIELSRCGNLEGNQKAFFWSQEL